MKKNLPVYTKAPLRIDGCLSMQVHHLAQGRNTAVSYSHSYNNRERFMYSGNLDILVRL